MTTIQKDKVSIPEQVTEQEHQALTASWQLPAHERVAPPVARSPRRIVVGLVAAVAALAVAFGAGYWTNSQTTESAPPAATPQATVVLDMNGMPLGRRVPPFETGQPVPAPVVVPVDMNGMTLGRRVPPFEPAPAAIAVDMNGMPLGRRVPSLETS